MHRTSAIPSASLASASPASASPAQGGIAALVGGDAAAFGTNTVATGDVTNKIQQNPDGIIIASGEAVFAAEGTGPGAQASANSGVNVTGADFVFEVTVNEHGGSGADAWAESVTRYVAIDIPGWTPPGGPIVVDDVINISVRGLSGSGHSLATDPPGGPGLPIGNFAHDIATAEASGPNTLAETSTLALTAENQLSAVFASALVAA